MIPLGLRLTDFMSYRDSGSVAFEGLDVVCLSGENGVGKSSLLDAMTWSLFGAARGCEGGQNQDRLIREGAEQATVEFSFQLTGEQYRVVRSRARSGRSQLRFEVRGPDGWTNLAGETLRDTEKRIGSLLRMDYRTFTASAFFLQGRADDFLARMGPEDRKDVFSRLLDLGVYERLEEAARERARDAERSRQRHSDRITELESATRPLEQLRGELAAASKAASALEAECARHQAALEQLRERVVAAERAEAQLKAEQAVLEARRQRLVEDAERLEQSRVRLGEFDELLERASEIDAAVAEASRLREHEETLRTKSALAAELSARRAALEAELDAGRKESERRVGEWDRRRSDLLSEIDRLEALARELADLEAAVASVGEIRSALEAQRSRLERLRDEDARLGAELQAMEQRQQALEERREILERGGGSCPVCAGSLDDAHRDRLLRDVTSEVESVRRDRKELLGRREAVRKEGRLLREEAGRLEKNLHEAGELAERSAALRARCERLPELRSEVEALEARLADERQALASETFAADTRRSLAALQAQVKDIAYDPADHEAVRKRISELGPMEALKGRIDAARTSRRHLYEEVKSLAASVTQARTEIAQRETEVDRRLAGLEAVDRLREELAAGGRALDEVRGHHARAEREQARLGERVSNLERIADELAGERRAEQAAASEHRVYRRLSTAFGRGGIPDRIIENALPELQHDTNEVLGRLSDYEMSVQFVMDKQTKSGRVQETFDVLVHHDGGVRDFQMFSGGEAFRIAFAIRLGLSKLLVRRAGARLETLVIDEGFGTQDPQGRERLVEVVNLARQDFRKVIVITHLEELKDAFGARMQVSRDPDVGSKVELVRG